MEDPLYDIYDKTVEKEWNRRQEFVTKIEPNLLKKQMENDFSEQIQMCGCSFSINLD